MVVVVVASVGLSCPGKGLKMEEFYGDGSSLPLFPWAIPNSFFRPFTLAIDDAEGTFSHSLPFLFGL